MATGREYLQSIFGSLTTLQNLSDERLESTSDGLKRVDDELIEAVEYIEEGQQ